MEKSSDFGAVLAGLKRSAAALRDAGIEFTLAGGLACWARGGDPTVHDVDLVIRRDDADKALAVLEDGGMPTERPPEGWLYKAWDGDVMIDVIFAPAGQDPGEILDRSTELTVAALPMKVMSATDVLVTKLVALSHHHLDYEGVLDVARPLREQIDWEAARRATAHSPFAKAFFTLVEELGIAPEASGG